MPYEIFDPANACNPLIPLNLINNKLTFFRVNVFELTLDKFVYQQDGKIDGPVRQKDLIPAIYRLGIPLSDLFPEIRKKLNTKFIKDNAFPPIRIGIEGVYLPVNKDYAKDPEITEINIFNDDIKKGTIKLGKSNIDVKEFINELNANGEVFYKDSGKIYKLQIPAQEVDINDGVINGNTLLHPSLGRLDFSAGQLSTLKKNGSLKLNLNGNDVLIKGNSSGVRPGTLFMDGGAIGFGFLDPSTLTDELYFEVLGDLLYDNRSGMREKGNNSKDIDSTFISDADFPKVLAAFKKDSRYKKYFIKLYPSDKMRAGQTKLPSYEIGLYTTYEQNWELQGYSRGALLNSISLAPQEQLSIEVFTFDRLKIEQEKEFTTEFEQNLDVTSLAKASAQISRDLTTTTDVNADVGLGIPLPIQGVPVNLNLNGGASNQVKEGLQDTINNINEVTVNSSEKFKSTTKVKIVQTQESGTETRTIRKINNPNASLTLTLNYYELLETYKVTTYLKKTKQFCLLINNPDFGPINIYFVMGYEDRLQKALLSSNYLPGFDAAKKLAAQRWFDERARIKQEIENRNGQNQPADSLPQKPIVRVALNLKKNLDRFLGLDLVSAAKVLAKHYDPFTPDSAKPSAKKVSDAEDGLGLFNYWLKFKIAAPGVESKARDFAESISDTSTEDFIAEQLESFLTGIDDQWLTTLKMVALDLVAIQLGSALVLIDPFLLPLAAELVLINNDNGLPAILDKAKAELKNYQLAQSAAAASSVVAPAPGGAAAAQLAAPVSPPPPQVFTIDELALAHAEFQKLALHIEANKTYYINKILLYEDSNQRFERLKLKGVSNFIENRLLGFVGDKSVFPLRIESLDKSTQDRLKNEISKFDPDKDENINGVDTKKIKTTLETITLPTSGVYSESLLGKCDALEPYLLDRRKIEKQMAQMQADLAAEKVNQQKEENKRLAERTKQGILDNPFKS